MMEVNWNKYNSDLNAALLGTNLTDLENVVALIRKVAGSNRTVWVIGNGGSAATASHFCVDLTKGCAIRIDKSIRAVPLMDLVPIQSAWSNDNSYGVALPIGSPVAGPITEAVLYIFQYGLYPIPVPGSTY